MRTQESGLRVLDLYCGAGGFSEGFRQAGFDIVAAIDNWAPALESHKINGLGDSDGFDMLKLIDEGGFELAKEKAEGFQRKYGRIDVLIGSPPCTEFSYAKKAGKGDIEKGMLLVRAHLVFVAALQPKFWLLENVPRLKNAIASESIRDKSGSWEISLERLGVTDGLSHLPWATSDTLLIPGGEIYVASHFGAPQNRKRFIAGNLNPRLADSKKVKRERTMEECLETLWQNAKNGTVTDPNYRHHKIKKSELRDYNYDTRLHPMYWEEMRHLKRRHIQYGRMSYPDNPKRTARTIMATLNPSSREAIIIDTSVRKHYQGKDRPVYRQPTVREVACLQGFPISFQFSGTTLATRYKQVGNAVPCQLSYALALAILDAFGEKGFENDNQESRFQETIRRWEENQKQPIIVGPNRLVNEAKDFYDSRYLQFRARKDKHIRRKLLSAKPFNTSAMVILENTEWEDGRKRRGGFWKSCVQLGVGKKFSQVYLDEQSVGIIIKSIKSHLNTIQESVIQTTLAALVEEDPNDRIATVKDADIDCLTDFRCLLAELFTQVDAGIPIVHEDWVEFPGYHNENSDKYLKMGYNQRLPLPSANKFQELFTKDYPETGGCVAPIDLFDGLDYLMLEALNSDRRRWIHEMSIPFSDLADMGSDLYQQRISRAALDKISGGLPLVNLIGGLLSVCVLYRMHSLDRPRKSPSYTSLSKAWRIIAKWCGYKPS